MTYLQDFGINSSALFLAEFGPELFCLQYIKFMSVKFLTILLVWSYEPSSTIIQQNYYYMFDFL